MRFAFISACFASSILPTSYQLAIFNLGRRNSPMIFEVLDFPNRVIFQAFQEPTVAVLRFTQIGKLDTESHRHSPCC